MSQLQIDIQTSNNADGLPAVTWVQDALSGRTKLSKAVWWIFWMVVLGTAIATIVTPSNGSSFQPGLLERLGLALVVAPMMGLTLVLMLMLIYWAGSGSVSEKQKAEELRRYTIINEEECRAEIVREDEELMLRVMRRDRSVLMWRCAHESPHFCETQFCRSRLAKRFINETIRGGG